MMDEWGINLAGIIKFKQGQHNPDLSHSLFCFIAILTLHRDKLTI